MQQAFARGIEIFRPCSHGNQSQEGLKFPDSSGGLFKLSEMTFFSSASSDFVCPTFSHFHKFSGFSRFSDLAGGTSSAEESEVFDKSGEPTISVRKKNSAMKAKSHGEYPFQDEQGELHPSRNEQFRAGNKGDNSNICLSDGIDLPVVEIELTRNFCCFLHLGNTSLVPSWSVYFFI